MELMMSAFKSMYAGILIPSSCCCYHRLSTDHNPPIAQVCSFNSNQFINFESYK